MWNKTALKDLENYQEAILIDLKEGKHMTFEELLLKLKVTENDYHLAVTSSLNALIEKKTK